MSALNVFASLAVLSFGASVLMAGLFTAYFGAGKSRKIGLGLTLLALIVLAFFVSATWNVAPGVAISAWSPGEVAVGISAVAGAALGAFVAFTAFLLSIMKA